MSALKIKDAQGNWIEVPMIKGDKGDRGEQGDTYELTEQDKQDIADLVDVPEPLKYVKDDSSDNGGVIEGYITGNYANEASGNYAHAEGIYTNAAGNHSHAEGYNSTTWAEDAHAEGYDTDAKEFASHSEGYTTIAEGYGSHSEGMNTYAKGHYSHAEGNYTWATGEAAHSEGYETSASGNYSHAEGRQTKASSPNQHVQGKYNIEDVNSTYAHIVGGGTSNNNRANIHTLDWNGNGVYAGKLTVGTAPTNDMDVATKKYVDDIKGASIHICSSAEYDSTTRVPTIQTPDEKTFYLVPSEDGTSPDLFIEWAYVNNAWEMFGSASIDLSGYVTNTDYATANDGGVVRVSGYGLKINSSNGIIQTSGATSGIIKSATGSDAEYRPVTPLRQHESTFYGLAKASGDSTQSASSNAVGTYTDEAKASIQNMLGVPSVDDVVDDVQINGTSILDNGVANIPVASSSNLGVVKVSGSYGINILNNTLIINRASSAQIKTAGAGLSANCPITPYGQHESTFYGLAKAAGHDEKDSTLTIGNYTPEAKGAIQSMLGIDSLIAPTETNPFTEAHAIGDLFIINGALYKAKTAIAVGDVLDDGVNVESVSVDDVAVKDVQINRTSVVSNGVANVPVASSSNLGVVKVNPAGGGGLFVNVSSGTIVTQKPDVATIKAGTHQYQVIVPQNQHISTFYGLTKAAGVDMASSSNAVGTYTDEAKTAIKQMLGVVDSYDSLVVNVTGTDPVITAQPSYRYNCGEVTSLTITPPSSGTIDFIFTSGTTPTVLDLPNTVKMPSWWIGVEANTTYEMCITDGVYCGVMSWDA